MEINRQTYAEFFLLYIDRELDPAERLSVEMFIEQNPDLKQELEILQQVTFIADPSIAFGDKSALYRREEHTIIPIGWKKMAAAAIVFLALGVAGWFFFTPRHNTVPPTVAHNEVHPNSTGTPGAVPPAIKKETGAPGMPEKNPDLVVTEKNIRREKKRATQSAPIKNTGIAQAAHNKNTGKPETMEEQKIPGYSQPEITIARNEPETEDIRIAVASFKPNSEQFIPDARQIQQPEYKFPVEENNIIYFANASLPKRTKFREVFRKASRVIEKVTSIGPGSDLLRRNDMVISTQ